MHIYIVRHNSIPSGNLAVMQKGHDPFFQGTLKNAIDLHPPSHDNIVSYRLISSEIRRYAMNP